VLAKVEIDKNSHIAAVASGGGGKGQGGRGKFPLKSEINFWRSVG